MKKLEWQDNLSVGVDLIDGQHKKWIDHFNDVADAVDAGHGDDKITETLGFLIDYTTEHFATEELHMSATGYAGLEEHMARHAELKNTLDNLVQEFEEEGATRILAESINTFLGNWLVKHIQDVDMTFGDFVRDSGIEVK